MGTSGRSQFTGWTRVSRLPIELADQVGFDLSPATGPRERRSLALPQPGSEWPPVIPFVIVGRAAAACLRFFMKSSSAGTDLMRRQRAIAWLAVLVLGGAGGLSRGDEPVNDSRARATWPGITRAGTVLLPNGWSLRPAGQQSPLGDLPVLLALHPSEPIAAILHAGYGEHEVVTVSTTTGRVIGRLALHQTFSGLVWSRDGKRLYAGGGLDDVIHGFDHASGLLSNPVKLTFSGPIPGEGTEAKGPRLPAGLALAGDGGTLWVANVFSHTIAWFDTVDQKQKGEISLGALTYPYGLVWDEPRGRLYVSLWGNAEVAVVDTSRGQVVDRWKTEEHPNEMLLARGGKVLYVANANRNTVSVFDTEAARPVETIGTAIDPRAPAGSTPSSLALAADESVLFVANANTNNLAVVNVKVPGESTPLGFIPTGWYPTSVRVARDGKTIYVANGKGASSKANRDGPNPLAAGGGDNKTREYIGGLFRGTLSTIAMPTPAADGALLANGLRLFPAEERRPDRRHGPETRRGEPDPVQGGPGVTDHSLCLHHQGEPDLRPGLRRPAPGQRRAEPLPLPHGCDAQPSRPGPRVRAARQLLRRKRGQCRRTRMDPGGVRHRLRRTDLAARLSGREKGALSRRGEQGSLFHRPPGRGLPLGPRRGQGCDLPELRRVRQEWRDGRRPLHDGRQGTRRALRSRVPQLRHELLRPEARRPVPGGAGRVREDRHHAPAGDPPAAQRSHLGHLTRQADADGLRRRERPGAGRVVEGLSRSRFWPGMAIFVVEDDAQNGSDHVDAHRTVALAISPYIKRHSVDSTMYSTSSMLRTIELCLGLDPMSQFDAAARPMSHAFTAAPDLTPYVHRPAQVDLGAKNLRTAWGAEQSQKLNLEIEDRADDIVFNEIIWKSVKGAASLMPPPVRAAFVMPRREKDKERDDDK